ncbi:MAG: ABC transporter ATP-binding protein [Candidatus Kariarchaeaceae archaeon]
MTKNLVKHFNKGQVKAVDGLDLKIKTGEIYAFIGANGSGKSTTISMLSGYLYPTSGSIKIMDYDVPKDRKKVSRYIGIAPQDYSLYNDLTVRENIEFFAKLFSMKKKEITIRIDELLKILNLENKRDTIADELSGGMKRRLSIACALVHSPPIVLFDEATVGVDPVLRAYFWDYFRKLRDEGKTILITSHVMDEAERADRIGLIRAGKLIDEGTPEELKQRHNVASIEEVFIKLSGGEYIDE